MHPVALLGFQLFDGKVRVFAKLPHIVELIGFYISVTDQVAKRQDHSVPCPHHPTGAGIVPQDQTAAGFQNLVNGNEKGVRSQPLRRFRKFLDG